MSIIAWDGKTLAADKRACMGTLILTTTKIHRVYATDREQDMLVGYAGETQFGLAMLNWLANGAQLDKFPESQRNKDDWCGTLVLQRGMPMRRYERTPFPITFEDPHFAMGSGRELALATMHLGFDARRAVEVACHFDTGCGNGVDVLTLDG